MKPLIRNPADINVEYQDVQFSSTDGTRLHGWFLPAQGIPRGTVVLLHGNAENISTHIGSVYWLPARGYNVFLFDYRGYGQSEGKPSIEGALADVSSAVRWALSNTEIDNSRVVVLGQSLGSALGVYAIGSAELKSRIRLLILDSSFGNYQRIAREKLATFWLTWPLQYPLSWTLPADVAPENVIADISPTPILFIHGADDTIVPLHHAQRLYDVAKQPKTFWVIPGSRHIAALQRLEVRNKLVTYLDLLLGSLPEKR
ncbi:MAG: alpha/beta hydrolase [Gammaproteobacteria bacterium]|nr:alpha/beta hydrolase [Gammaproteobacteria bacterium]